MPSIIPSSINAARVAGSHLEQVQRIATIIQNARKEGVAAQVRMATDPVTRRPIIKDGRPVTEPVSEPVTAEEYETALGTIGENLTVALGCLSANSAQLAEIAKILAPAE